MATKILIADSSDEFRLTLADALQNNYTVFSCRDGDQALELLRAKQPDLLVMDLMISGVDGLMLLEKARAEGICPPVLVTTNFLGSYVIDALRQYDVVYAVLKPCAISAITARIDDLSGRIIPAPQLRPTPHAIVTSALMELSLPAKRSGFRYCREAILMLAENPGLQVTKHVYPEIAKRNGCKAEAIEKAVRDAITAAWDERSDAVWRRYFAVAPNGQIPRPSNRVFLATVTEVLFSVQANVI